MKAGGRGTVFVNYRKGDAATCAALLAHTLAAKVGKNEIFLAPRSIPVGDDFEGAILDALCRCRVLIPVIGPHWLTVGGSDGRKLDESDDWVRREIAEALRTGKRIVPVLVEDARMPRREELPAEIADLAQCQYRHLMYRSVPQEIERLVTDLIHEVPEFAVICLPGSEDLSDWWIGWSSATEPALPAELMLAGRGPQAAEVIAALSAEPAVLYVRGDSREQAMAFFAALVSMQPGQNFRSIVVTDPSAWPRCVAVQQSCVLVPLFDDPDVTEAVRQGHRVVVPLGPNGLEGTAAVLLPQVGVDEARTAFEAAGVAAPQAQAWAIEARRSLPELRRSLSRADTDSAARFDRPVDADQNALAYAVNRGPLRHLGLDADLASADELSESEPMRAAALYEEIAEKLLAARFSVHSAPIRTKQAKALAKADEYDQAALIVLDMLWNQLADSEEDEEAEQLLVNLRRGDQLRPDITRAVNFVLSVPNVLGGHVGVGQQLAGVFDQLHDDDPHLLEAAVFVAEQALATRDEHIVTSRIDAMIVLAAGVETINSRREQSVVRLGMCIAEVTGSWDRLTGRANREFAACYKPWISARMARWHFLANRIEDAVVAYETAIADALTEGMNEEAADWLYALRAVRSKQGSLFAEGDAQHPFAQHLRKASRVSRLPGNPTIEERALRSLQAGKPRRSVGLLSRWRWKSYVRADLAREMEATRELGALLAQNQEPMEGLRNLVWAEARTQATKVAKGLPEQPVRWPVDTMGNTAAQTDAALAVTGACADLLVDEDALEWVTVALDAMQGRGPRAALFSDLVRYGTEALTALAPCLTQDQASTALDIVAPWVVRAPGHYRHTDRDHAALLIDIATDHKVLADRAVTQLVDGLAVNDDFAHQALGRSGLPLLCARATAVADTLAPFADQGNHWVCVALALIDRPTDAVRARAWKAAEQVITRPDPAPNEMSIWANHDALAAMAHLLDTGTRAELAEAMLRHARDRADVTVNRRNALDGLGRLATLLDDGHRRNLFDALMPLARGEGGESTGDILFGVTRHPLSFLRTDFGPETPADAAAHACALIALTDQDRFAVREQALRLLAGNTEVSVPLIVSALNTVSPSAHELPPAFLATHSHPQVQALAAVLWAGEPTDPELGLCLAVSPHRIVRSSLAGELGERPAHLAVREVLAKDPRRSIRRRLLRPR